VIHWEVANFLAGFGDESRLSHGEKKHDAKNKRTGHWSPANCQAVARLGYNGTQNRA
jgi:hypothetical protein